MHFDSKNPDISLDLVLFLYCAGRNWNFATLTDRGREPEAPKSAVGRRGRVALMRLTTSESHDEARRGSPPPDVGDLDLQRVGSLAHTSARAAGGSTRVIALVPSHPRLDERQTDREEDVATMFPEQIPAEFEATRSEVAFHAALAEALPDDFYVYFSTPYLSAGDARQGESDFLVLHHEHGLLNIEVKGGGFRRDGHKWVSVSPGGGLQERKNPAVQARDQLKRIVEKLTGRMREVFPHEEWALTGRLPLVFGWSLAFPFTRVDDVNVPMEFEREVLIDCDDLERLEEAVLDAFRFYRRAWKREGDVPKMKRPDFERFCKQVLSPAFNLVPNLAGLLAAERRTFVRLSETQRRGVRQILANDRIRIPGGAGTGKTILALEAARRVADQGKRVLLLCYNRHLRHHLCEEVEEMVLTAGGSIEVGGFVQLCFEAGRRLEKRLTWPKDEDPGEFIVNEAPLRLFEAVDAGLFEPYDAIIVDEGQDFAGPWWEVLELMLSEQGKMAVFYDDAQSIFEHGNCVPQFPAVFPLFENFRNTRAIAEPVQTLGGVEMESHPDCPVGEAPTIFQQPGPSKTLRMVDELVESLIDAKSVPPETIVILTPHSPKSSTLKDVQTLGGRRVVHAIQNRPSNTVLHTSISSFKGLEADVVILVDIDPADPRCSTRDRYVAASRARHRLYVFEKAYWLGGEPR